MPGAVKRFAVLAAGLILLLSIAFISVRSGVSRLLSDYALLSSSVDPADDAVRFAPADPEAHDARANTLLGANNTREGIPEFERAVQLRPRDYALWTELGRARDQAGDKSGALSAFKEAVRLAPYYAAPRWQLGNLLFRAGQRDEAFAELRRAAASDPSLVISLIDLAWNANDGDAHLVLQSVQPRTTQTRLALARFFAKHGRAAEAVTLFGAAGGNASSEDQRALVTELIAAKDFPEAYQAWAGSHAEAARNRDAARAVAVVINEGFESPISKDNAGFGWQVMPGAQFVQASVDAIEPHNGTRSLRLEFGGNAAQNSPFISQLVLVEPNARYRLRFAARTKDIVTGGLPVVAVSDANLEQSAPVLVQSTPLAQGTSAWREYTVEFATPATCRAVLIRLQRPPCSSSPCPIFGTIWFDDFSLQKM